MKDEETGKFLPGYLLEQGYKNMINSAPNLTQEQKVEAIATIEDTRQQLEAKYKVDPITNSTLSALLSSADIRLPLIKQDFNLAGRKLADEASRDKLNSLVNGRVRKVVPSHVTARLTYTSTVVSPEQPLAQKSIPTSSRSWQQLTVEDIDQTAPVNYGSFLDENNPLTKFILAALPQSRFKGVFPLKARPKD